MSDCAGSLEVERRGHKGHLHFACRIGHAYAVAELLAAKEQRLEERLWTAVVALDELTMLLDDLAPQAVRECGEGAGPACQHRSAALRTTARALRAMIEKDRPLHLGRDIPGVPETTETGPPA